VLGIYIGILLGAHYILRISRIRVNERNSEQLGSRSHRGHSLPWENERRGEMKEEEDYEKKN
jgi:hypothetical protein